MHSMGNPVLRPGMDEEKLARLFAQGEDLGLKMELTDGGITWETFPGIRHQEIVFGVQTSFTKAKEAKGGCDCFQVADADIVLPDGTVKRPDISVWCKRPHEEEGFVHEVPEAVIEIVSPDYEAKDLVDGPPIYLRNGVKDVIVFDRMKGDVHHWGSFGHRTVASPTTLELACDCRMTV